jgi:predicted peptidase
VRRCCRAWAMGHGWLSKSSTVCAMSFLSTSDGFMSLGSRLGGTGVWNVIAGRPGFFAAAAVCCGSRSTEDGTEAIDTPLWAFQGDADKTVPVSLWRDRIAARRKAGGLPLYTEYAGVDHNCWEWAFTEPELVKWLSAQRRS